MEKYLDPKSMEYLQSWQKGSKLDQGQKENIENSRAVSAQKILLDNRALSGVLSYRDWTRSSQDLVNMNLEVGPGGVGPGGTGQGGLSLAPLRDPPAVEGFEEYIDVITGVGIIRYPSSCAHLT